jgi:putative transposase
VAERLVKSVRNELLNNVIVFNEDHLRRLMREYVGYYNKDRCHLSLERDSPLGRAIQKKPSEFAKAISIPKLNGMQHCYEWQEAV